MRSAGTAVTGCTAAATLLLCLLGPVQAAAEPAESQVQVIEIPLTAQARAAVGLSASAAPRADDPVADDQAAVVVESEPVETRSFSLVGATWAAAAAADAAGPRVEVRTGSGSGWGQWQVLPPLDGGPDATSPEGLGAVTGATAGLWVGPATAVQTRVTTGSAGTATPSTVRLNLVDPGTSGADDDALATRSAGVAAAAAGPAIVSRAAWGADESKKNCDATYNDTVKAAVVHHTAGSNSYTTQAQAIQQLRADYAYHTDVLGWCDLGYNAVVDKFGTIYEGRAGGMGRAVSGAHAGGFNTDTFGVSALGNYSEATAPSALVSAVARLVSWKLAMYDRDPYGSVTLTSSGGGTSRYPAGTQVSLPVVMGHRDVGQTECPGTSLYAALPSIRTAALAAIPAPVCTGGDVDPRALAISAFSSNVWSMRRDATGGKSQGCFAFGLPTDTPLWADFDGNGSRTPVVFRGGLWFFTATPDASGRVTSFRFGNPGDQPVVGDWNRDGTESPGVFRPSTGQWYLSNRVLGARADGQFGFGSPGDRAVVGDWNNDRTDTLGVFRAATGTWYLTNALWPGQQSAQGWYRYGQRGDQPVVGDWNRDGTDTPGVVRAAAGEWFLTDQLSSGTVLRSSRRFGFGAPGSVAGIWR